MALIRIVAVHFNGQFRPTVAAATAAIAAIATSAAAAAAAELSLA